MSPGLLGPAPMSASRAGGGMSSSWGKRHISLFFLLIPSVYSFIVFSATPYVPNLLLSSDVVLFFFFSLCISHFLLHFYMFLAFFMILYPSLLPHHFLVSCFYSSNKQLSLLYLVSLNSAVSFRSRFLM